MYILSPNPRSLEYLKEQTGEWGCLKQISRLSKVYWNYSVEINWIWLVKEKTLMVGQINADYWQTRGKKLLYYTCDALLGSAESSTEYSMGRKTEVTKEDILGDIGFIKQHNNDLKYLQDETAKMWILHIISCMWVKRSLLQQSKLNPTGICS